MLKAPSWCPDATPSLRGWHHPHTGEVLKSALHHKAEVNEWWAHHHGHAQPAPAPYSFTTSISSITQTLTEAPSAERELHDEEVNHYYGNQVEEHHSDHEE